MKISTAIAAAIVASSLLATPVAAADPLACEDTRVLQQVRENLKNTATNAQPPRSFVELKDPREALLGAPPSSANQYATASNYIAVSRYCEGRAEFEAGEPEPVYWRLDLVKDGPNESGRFDLCHKHWDQFENGCKAFRPGG